VREVKKRANDDIKVSIKVRDTLHLSPQQGGSLDKLGDVLGFEKIKLSEDSIEEKEIKTNMKSFLESDWERFREYGIRDSDIYIKSYNEIIGIFYHWEG